MGKTTTQGAFHLNKEDTTLPTALSCRTYFYAGASTACTAAAIEWTFHFQRIGFLLREMEEQRLKFASHFVLHIVNSYVSVIKLHLLLSKIHLLSFYYVPSTIYGTESKDIIPSWRLSTQKRGL